jgi:heavy metal sensor kinase
LVSLQAEARKASALILLASTLMLGVTILFSLWEVRRGLLPLQKLAAEATAVSAQNWNFRVPDEVQQIEELQPLSESITHMLKRLHDSFTQQKEFVANAAHEFKTPVAVLKSTLQTVLQRPRLAEEYKTGLQCALEDLDRLEMLLQGMLRLALAEQWEQRESVRDLHTVELGASCEEAIERFRALAETRDLKISFSRNGFAPVRADPDDLRIVWTNLLENAVRYSREGGPVEVSIARKNNRIVQVVFADHGQGIAEADLPHIFERFYRGDPSRTRSTGGFGLGLAIARTLIAAYGGTIWADSEPGQGTRITVELPFEDIRPSSYS